MILLHHLHGALEHLRFAILLRLQQLLIRRRPRGPARILVPFTRGALEPTVLDAAVRIARAEDATLVPAYLILIPLEFALDAPMHREVALAMPLLEAVERTALLAGVPVDARIESGRTAIHALERLWCVEHFARIVVPAPTSRRPGFTPADLLWILTHAPSETVILRPDPAAKRSPARTAPADSREPDQPQARLSPGRRAVPIRRDDDFLAGLSLARASAVGAIAIKGDRRPDRLDNAERPGSG